MLISLRNKPRDRLVSVVYFNKKKQYKFIDINSGFEEFNIETLGYDHESSIPSLIFLRYHLDEERVKLIVIIKNSEKNFKVFGYGLAEKFAELDESVVDLIKFYLSDDSEHSYQGGNPEFSFTDEAIKDEENKYILSFAGTIYPKSEEFNHVDPDEIFKRFLIQVDHNKPKNEPECSISRSISANELASEKMLEGPDGDSSTQVEQLQEVMRQLDGETEVEDEGPDLSRPIDFVAGIVELSMRLTDLFREISVEYVEDSIIPKEVVGGLGVYNLQILEVLKVILSLDNQTNRLHHEQLYTLQEVIDAIENENTVRKLVIDITAFNPGLLDAFLESLHSGPLVMQWIAYFQSHMAVELAKVLEQFFKEQAGSVIAEPIAIPDERFALSDSLVSKINELFELCEALKSECAACVELDTTDVESDTTDQKLWGEYLEILETLSLYLSQLIYISQLSESLENSLRVYQDYSTQLHNGLSKDGKGEYGLLKLVHRIIFNLELLSAKYLRSGTAVSRPDYQRVYDIVGIDEDEPPIILCDKSKLFGILKEVMAAYLKGRSPLQRYLHLVDTVGAYEALVVQKGTLQSQINSLTKALEISAGLNRGYELLLGYCIEKELEKARSSPPSSARKNGSLTFEERLAKIIEWNAAKLDFSEVYALFQQKYSTLLQQINSIVPIDDINVEAVEKIYENLLKHIIQNILLLINSVNSHLKDCQHFIKLNEIKKLLTSSGQLFHEVLKDQVPGLGTQKILMGADIILDENFIIPIRHLFELLRDNPGLGVNGDSLNDLIDKLRIQLVAIVVIDNSRQSEELNKLSSNATEPVKVAVSRSIKAGRTKRLLPIMGSKDGETTTVVGAQGELALSAYGRQLNACEQSIFGHTEDLGHALVFFLRLYQLICCLENRPLSVAQLDDSKRLIISYVGFCVTRLADIHAKNYVDMGVTTKTSQEEFESMCTRNTKSKQTTKNDCVKLLKKIYMKLAEAVNNCVRLSDVKIFPAKFAGVVDGSPALWNREIQERDKLLASGLESTNASLPKKPDADSQHDDLSSATGIVKN